MAHRLLLRAGSFLLNEPHSETETSQLFNATAAYHLPGQFVTLDTPELNARRRPKEPPNQARSLFRSQMSIFFLPTGFKPGSGVFNITRKVIVDHNINCWAGAMQATPEVGFLIAIHNT